MNLIYNVVNADANKVPLLLEPPKAGSATSELIEILDKFSKNPKNPTSEKITFSPQRWYTGRDLTVIFKQLRGIIEHTLDVDRKEINGMSGEELGIPRGQKDVKVQDVKKKKLTERIKDRIETLKKVKDLLPGIVKDYKERLEDFEKKINNPLEMSRIRGEKDLEWVDNSSKWMLQWREILFPVSEQEAIQKELEKGVLELKDLKDQGILKRETPKAPPKEKGSGMVEFTKFKDLENLMIAVQEDIANWAKRLGDTKAVTIPSPDLVKTAARMTEISDKDLRKKFLEKWDLPRPLTEKQLEEKKKDQEVLEKKIEDLSKAKKKQKEPRSLGQNPSEEDLAEFVRKMNVPDKPIPGLQEIESEFDDFLRNMRDAHPQGEEGYSDFMKFLGLYKEDKTYQGIPPAHYTVTLLAHLISSNLQDFKKMHSMYNGVIWSRSRLEEKELGERHKQFVTKDAEEEAVKEKDTSLDTLYTESVKLRSEAVSETKDFAKIDVYSHGAYSRANVAQKAINKFIKEAEEYLKKLTVKMTPEQLEKLMVEQGIKKEPKKASVSELIRHFAVELKDQVTVKEFDKIFPYEKTKAEIRANCKETFKRADEELDEIRDFFEMEYVKPRPKLVSLAAAAKVTPQEYLEEKIPQILKSFLKVWEKHEKDLTEKAPLFREEGEKTVKSHPTLSKLLDDFVKAEKIPPLAKVEHVYLTKAIPKKHEFLNFSEKLLLSDEPPASFEKKLLDFEHIREKDYSESDREKTAGGGGTRKKEVTEIAQGMKEVMKRRSLGYLKDLIDDKISPKELVKKTVEDVLDELNSSFQFNTLDKGTVIRDIISILLNITSNMSQLKIIAPGVTLSQKRDPWTPSKPSVLTTPSGEKSKPHTVSQPEHEKLRTLKEYQDYYKGTQWEKEFNDMTESEFKDYVGKQAAKYEGPKVPQHAPGEKDTGDTIPTHMKNLFGPGPWRAHKHGFDLVLSGTVEQQYKQAQKIKSKIEELHKEIEKLTDIASIDRVYPMGLLDSIEMLNKELKKGDQLPLKNPEKMTEEKGKLEKEREQRKSAVLYDFSTQMSMNVAAKFAGIELSRNEFENVVS